MKTFLERLTRLSSSESAENTTDVSTSELAQIRRVDDPFEFDQRILNTTDGVSLVVVELPKDTDKQVKLNLIIKSQNIAVNLPFPLHVLGFLRDSN